MLYVEVVLEKDNGAGRMVIFRVEKLYIVL